MDTYSSAGIQLPCEEDSEPPLCTGEIEKLEKNFEHLGDVYSKAQPVVSSWGLDVNLNPPKCWGKDSPASDDQILDYYNSLQYILYETGYPETEDRTARPRKKNNPEQVVVAILESPVECMSALLEGGRMLPDGFHLVMSPTWLSKVESNNPNLCVLLLHKAITFHKDGSTYIDEFEEPRRVTYFVNFFTHVITAGTRSDGEEIEKNLECPMSSSIQLAEMVDCKVWTRCIMSEVGLAFPETLAFMYKPKRKCKSSTRQITIVDVDENTDMNRIGNEIQDFLEQPFMKTVQRIVVKPSGPGFFGSIGVSFHNIADIAEIEEAAKLLLADVAEGSSVLIESFIETFKPEKTDSEEIKAWKSDAKLGFRVRVTCARDYNDKPRTTMIVCGILDKSQPINGDNTVGQSLDSTLLAYNVFDVDKRRILEYEVMSKAEAVLGYMIEYEKTLTLEEKGAPRGQTDVIGLDMIISLKNGVLVPHGIEVNSHDCTINCHINDFMKGLLERTVALKDNGEREIPNLICATESDDIFVDEKNGTGQMQLINTFQSQSLRPWVRTMIQRSQLYLMQGKNIVVVGAGGFSKRFIFTEAQKYGIKITLIDSDANHYAKDHVHCFLHYQFDDHTENNDVVHACNIVNELQGRVFDGCVTFWEDCGPLAALICELLGTKGQTYEAALNGKKKSRTQQGLRERTADIPHWPRTYLYSSESYLITCQEDLDLIINRLEYPVILKLEHGSSAVGVQLVHSQAEMEKEYATISNSLKTDADFHGIGLGHDNSMLVMDYLRGSEHDVDVVICGRKLVAAFISDNGPTRVPIFTETAASMPTSLPVDKQAQLVTAAYQSCIEIGLSDGTFNVELRMTPTGPKLIEVNARMGGFYLRPWIQRIYGVDLMLFSFMACCGIRPFVPKFPPTEQLMGIVLLPSLHKHITDNEDNMKIFKDLEAKGELIYTQISDSPDEAACGKYEEPYAHISVIGRNVKDTKEKLLKLCKEFGIDCKGYDVTHFLEDF